MQGMQEEGRPIRRVRGIRSKRRGGAPPPPSSSQPWHNALPMRWRGGQEGGRKRSVSNAVRHTKAKLEGKKASPCLHCPCFSARAFHTGMSQLWESPRKIEIERGEPTHLHLPPPLCLPGEPACQSCLGSAVRCSGRQATGIGMAVQCRVQPRSKGFVWHDSQATRPATM